MTQDPDICYQALRARDARFDGVFFVGVTSTSIYCRPVCTAKTPGRERCRFFGTAAAAEKAGFRPCLRCRPELAPGLAPIDNGGTLARTAAARIEAGALRDGSNLETLASSLNVSPRQLRRLVRKELGVSPVELAQTARLLLAKRLIAETRLSMAEVAFASGFASVRRFNALFQSHYRLTPRTLRRGSAPTSSADSIRLTLAYRPPLAWRSLLRFLMARAIPGVECVTDDAYHRTVALGQRQGWLKVTAVPGRNLLAVELATNLVPVLPTILARLRHVFDLDARPDVIADHLGSDPHLAPFLQSQPGLRVPGAFDTFELAMRTILGQQVSVRGATTLAGRFVERFSAAIETPLPCLNRLTPSAAAIAASSVNSLAGLGVPGARADCLRTLAQMMHQGDIDLEPGPAPHEVVDKLLQLPGIGPWTAVYIAMRALRWPDAFPAGDLGLRKVMKSHSTRTLEKAAQRWRPWRAYAAMHLWESLKTPCAEPST